MNDDHLVLEEGFTAAVIERVRQEMAARWRGLLDARPVAIACCSSAESGDARSPAGSSAESGDAAEAQPGQPTPEMTMLANPADIAGNGVDRSLNALVGCDQVFMGLDLCGPRSSGSALILMRGSSVVDVVRLG